MKSCLKLIIVLILSGFIKMNAESQTFPSDGNALRLLPGELWWGGVTHHGEFMPFGKTPYSYDMYGEAAGNQAVPLLISNKGRYVWSEDPFRFSFRNDSLIIDKAYAELKIGKSGNTLKEAYSYASRNFFPSTGLWPDSLLVTAPQYNLWIELMYVPTQKDVLDYAFKVLYNGMPPGVLMIDDNWTNYYGHFDFDVKKFPDPKAMIDQLHSVGFKVMLWICPFISPDSEAFRELEAKKFLLLDNGGNTDLEWKDTKKPLIIKWWNGYSACLDLSNPGTVDWLHEKLNYLNEKYGVDGYKLDAGDPNYYKDPRLLSYKKLLPNDHSILWGDIGLEYPLNEYRAMWKMAGQPLVERLRDKEHNWEDLQTLIPNTIAQQLAGYTFTCPDMIGGGEFLSFLPGSIIDQNLIVRSAQCHALMPMMQFSVAPWRILDPVHLAAVKKSVDIRQQYIPYIMEVLRNSAITGEPALRPLEYDYPGQGYENIKDQFLIGDKLMVAPIVTPGNTREVIFPKGSWKYKNLTIKGPVIRTFNVELDELLRFDKIK